MSSRARIYCLKFGLRTGGGGDMGGGDRAPGQLRAQAQHQGWGGSQEADARGGRDPGGGLPAADAHGGDIRRLHPGDGEDSQAGCGPPPQISPSDFSHSHPMSQGSTGSLADMHLLCPLPSPPPPLPLSCNPPLAPLQIPHPSRSPIKHPPPPALPSTIPRFPGRIDAFKP